MIRVLVADDNAVIRMGVVSLLQTADDIEIVGEASTGQEAIDLAARVHPDVVLLDVRMPVLDGVAAVATVSRRSKVLMLTYSEDADVVSDALRAGAAGYLIHGRFEPADLLRAVRATYTGQAVLSPTAATVLVDALRQGPRTPLPDHVASGLSDRERGVMDLIARGLSNRAIAEELYLSEKTVKNHVNRIYAKLGVTSRGEAIASWLGLAEQRTA